MIAATVAFDHFTRELSRPEPGATTSARAPSAIRSCTRTAIPTTSVRADGMLGQTPVVIPNGTTGYLRDVGFGGHPLENALSTTNGDYDVEYIENAGSYYDKINTAILLALSEDRFISQSRRDFYDARFRAVGMADVLPDGFRRVIANALTGDRSLLAPHVDGRRQRPAAARHDGADTASDPMRRRCYPKFAARLDELVADRRPGDLLLDRRAATSAPTTPATATFAPDRARQHGGRRSADRLGGAEVPDRVDASRYITANQKTNWIDMMRIWRLGQNIAPDVTPRIEWQDPISGETLLRRDDRARSACSATPPTAAPAARSSQKGIAARVLEYANQLTADGYELDIVNNPATATTAGRLQRLRARDGRPPAGRYAGRAGRSGDSERDDQRGRWPPRPLAIRTSTPDLHAADRRPEPLGRRAASRTSRSRTICGRPKPSTAGSTRPASCGVF